jgi:hypothetical protein
MVQDVSFKLFCSLGQSSGAVLGKSALPQLRYNARVEFFGGVELGEKLGNLS